MDVLKKIIIKKLNLNIKYWTRKVEEMFGKKETTEKDLLNGVWNIHCSMLAKNLVLKNDYEYSIRNNKIYYTLPNGKTIYLMESKPQYDTTV